ncbi:MAG TPA: multiheme c-type cytochrome [Bryobacterales bacterium]|jgi:hypothetical protein|nr:multiheme c-type cytochrome [Bryobacterales bacterium]
MSVLWSRLLGYARRLGAPLVLLYAGSSLAAQSAAPSAYIGARACAECHADRVSRQQSAGHAQALAPAADHPLAAAFTPPTMFTRPPNFRFQFLRPKQLQVRVFDGDNTIELPVEWAFGAGAQAVTFVTRVNEQWYLEHYFSYYSGLRSFAPTPGQDAIRPSSLVSAVGLLYKALDPDTGIVGCFECHSTGPVITGSEGIRPRELGVRCEACHGPGSAHVRAAKEGPSNEIRKAIQNPGRLPASQLNVFCGRCHRPPAAKGTAIDWNYAWNVRHQPVYFSQSACFRKSQGALTCLTCHNPHEPLRRDNAFYNQHCLDCHKHSGGEPQIRAAVKAHPPRPVCESRQPANCIDCHMPRVSPQAGLRFTNHWIGVYAEGAKLKPRSEQ